MPIAGQTAKSGRRQAFSLAALAQLILFVFSCVLISGCAADKKKDAQLLWKYSAPRKSHWTAKGTADRPIVAGDIVIYTGGYPDRNEVFLNAVDLKSGNKLWSSPNSVSQFMVSGDTVFYTTIDSMTIPQPGKKKKEWLRSVDITTGKLKWEKMIETSYGRMQFLSDGSMLYLYINDAQICGMSKETGEVAWQQMLPSISPNAKYTPASVAASGDILFAAMPNHTISVIDGTAGKIKSVISGLRSPAGDGRRTIMAAGNLIILVDSDGYVSTVNGSTAKISTPIATGPLDSPPSIDDSAVYLSASEAGTQPQSKTTEVPKTGVPAPTKESPATEKKDAPPAVSDSPPPPTSDSPPPPTSGSPPATSSALAPQAQHYLCAIAVDNVTPSFKWQTNVNGLVNQSPVLDDKLLVVGTATGAGQVLAYKKGTGQFLWSYDSGPVTGRPAIDEDIVFASSKDDLLALNASTGKLLWKYQLENTTPAAGPIISGSTLLLVGRDSNLYAIKLEKMPTRSSQESTTTKNASTTGNASTTQ